MTHSNGLIALQQSLCPFILERFSTLILAFPQHNLCVVQGFSVFFTFNPRYRVRVKISENPCHSALRHNAVPAETDLSRISSMNNTGLKGNSASFAHKGHLTSQVEC